MRLRWPFQILLLSVVVLCIYFPTLNAEVSIVDDKDAIAGIYNDDSVSIRDILLPRLNEGGYYRPLIGIAYYIDKSLWDLNIRAMHLDNIIMHLINVFLVYALTLVSCRDGGGKDSNRLLPLISALLFAVHPMATESVNWISGRTDPMAANFVLSAAILLVLYRNSRKVSLIASAIFMVVMAVLAKEASLGMVLASGLILCAHKSGQPTDLNSIVEQLSWSAAVRDFLIFYSVITIEVLYFGNYWLAIAGALAYAVYLLKPHRSFHSSKAYLVKMSGIFAVCGLVSVSLYFVLRRIAFKSDVGKISQTIKLMLEDTNYTISLFVGASGFYLKKFFFPLPFSFFILEIDPMYDLLGIAVMLFCMVLIVQNSLESALFIAGVCMFIPALPFAFGTIAWTGYAERYIYISSAFWIISTALYLDDLRVRNILAGKVIRVVTPAIFLFFCWQTYSRNIVWQKNLTLLADTVEKSPRSAVVREMYMQALVSAGQYELAKKQYEIGKSRSIFISEGPELILAQILVKEGKQDEALARYESLIVKSNFKSERALKSVISLIDDMARDKAENCRLELNGKKKHYESLLLNISSDPMLFYNLGQKAIGSGNKIAAIGFFERSNSLFSEDSPYKEYSSRLVAGLKNELKH